MKSESAKAKFDALVDWAEQLINREKAPGFIVGISGTDSVLAFLVCYRALKRTGRQDRLIGVHYGAPFPPLERTAEQIAKALEISPSYRWVPRILLPWLQEQAPEATISVDSSIDVASDQFRWADIFRRSVNSAAAKDSLDASEAFWVVGTRNATEDALGTYSNLSKAASLQPLIHLWKSDILSICEWLGVPRIAVEQSRQADCDCGRYDLAAAHISEIDAILRDQADEPVPEIADMKRAVGTDVWQRLIAFVLEQKAFGGFKKRIPYMPMSAKEKVWTRFASSVESRLRNLGSTFPVWRFPAEQVDGKSLLESWGMTRLERVTDIRDPSLPNPDRDELGTGYYWFDKHTNSYTELRRAYYLVSFLGEHPITVVIRNNSPYFGWDRLPDRVYVSFEATSLEELQAITAEAFRPGGKFKAWIGADNNLGGDEIKLQRLANALDWLEVLRVEFHEWLTQRTEGMLAFIKNLEVRCASGLPLPYLIVQRNGELRASKSIDAAFVSVMSGSIASKDTGVWLSPLLDCEPDDDGDSGKIWLASGPSDILPLD
jgi:NH3-dependent NAD+ synthetase